MDRGKSYWTKRRALRKLVSQHLDNIVTIKNLDDQAASSISETNDKSKSSHDQYAQVEDVGTSVDDGIPEFDVEYAGFDFDIGSECDDSDCEDEIISKENMLSELLAKWAVKQGITQAALKDLLDILRPLDPTLPKDPRTLLKTTEVVEIKSVAGGSYYHFGLEDCLRQQLDSLPDLKRFDTISVLVNVDGLPLFKSGPGEMWPILGQVKNVESARPFVIGLFYGAKKPTDVQEYFNDFVADVKHLQDIGMMHDGERYNVAIAGFVCDTPARAFIKCTKGHNGYSGCDKCTQAGVYDGRMTFPEVDAQLRTDVAFDEMSDEDHHRGPSPLTRLGIGMVSCFPLDYMHLVCLGVTRKLLTLLIKGPLHCRIGSRARSLISTRLLCYKSFMPQEFVRKPRDLAEMDRWKATEFRQFLLYTGPVCLAGNVAEEVYNNFLLLSVSIHLLVNPLLCHSYLDYAHQLLVSFVQHFSQLFGPTALVYNVHCLVHLTEDVKKYGPLDQFSAFPFENYLGMLKRLLRKPSYPLKQVVKRIQECSKFFCADPLLVSGGDFLKKTHTRGPLPSAQSINEVIQFGEAVLKHFTISRFKGDNCVKVGSQIAIVKNILKYESGVYVLYKVFQQKCCLFEYPVLSSHLDVWKVSDLSDRLHTTPISHVIGKYVLLPHRGHFVVTPLIHAHF